MFLLIIFCIALVVFLFSMDLSWANVISTRRNDLVFEGRNKDYGAYALRREHHMNIFYALLVSVGLIGGGMFVLQFVGRKTNAVFSAPAVITELSSLLKTNPPEKKPDQPRKADGQIARAAVAASAGATNTEVHVVEQGGEAGRKIDKQGGDGEGPSDLVQPYDPGTASGGEGKGMPGNDDSDKKKRHVVVKNMPEFPGGMNEFIRYVQSKMKYTEYELMHNVGGTMYVSFTIFPDGNVGEIIVERGIPYGERLEKRIANVLLEMPQWKPGDNGEEPLAVIMKMPLKFELRP
jgi:protein TonB